MDLDQDFDIPPPLDAVVEVQKRVAARLQKKRTEEEAARKRKLEEEAAEPDEAEEDLDGDDLQGLAMPGALPATAIIHDDDEPPCFEAGGSLLSGLDRQPAPPELRFLQTSGLARDEAERSAAWRKLLAQRAVVNCCDASDVVLQALFATACGGTSDVLQAQAAFEELDDCWRDASAVTSGTSCQGLWTPSLSDLWQGLVQLGYQEPSSSNGVGSSSSAAEVHVHSGPSSDSQGSAGAPSAVDTANTAALWRERVRGVKVLLQMTGRLCELHMQPGLVKLDFAKHHKGGNPEAAKRLLLATHRMRLDPTLREALDHELSSTGELLAQAWDERAWRSTEPGLAQELAGLGPSHRATLRVLGCPVGAAPQAMSLSQAAALALLRTLLSKDKASAGAGGSSSSSSGAARRSLASDLKKLLGEPQDVRHIISAVSKGTVVDYWKLRTVVQAADAIMWPLQVAGKLSDMERRWWASELHALEGQDRVCKDQKAAGVRSILSGIKNNHEFNNA